MNEHSLAILELIYFFGGRMLYFSASLTFPISWYHNNLNYTKVVFKEIMYKRNLDFAGSISERFVCNYSMSITP